MNVYEQAKYAAQLMISNNINEVSESGPGPEGLRVGFGLIPPYRISFILVNLYDATYYTNRR
jgi:hypothetical protein